MVDPSLQEARAVAESAWKVTKEAKRVIAGSAMKPSSYVSRFTRLVTWWRYLGRGVVWTILGIVALLHFGLEAIPISKALPESLAFAYKYNWLLGDVIIAFAFIIRSYETVYRQTLDDDDDI